MELKEQKLSRKELKKIAEQAISQKAAEENINITSINPLTSVEYYKSDFFKKKLKLYKTFHKLNCVTTPIICNGINNNNHIIIFIDNFSKIAYLGLKHQLVDFLQTSFHELGHSHQVQNFNNYTTFELFNNLYLNNFIRKHNDTHYQKYHDEYLTEKDADLFGVNCTESFLKKYPNLYSREKEYLERKKLQYEYNYQNFDFHLFWEEFYKIYQQEPKLYQHENLVSTIFFEKNSNTYKKIKDIMTSEDFDWIGEKLFFSILTSPSFLSQLDPITFDIEELQTVIDALEYMLKEAEITKELNENLQNKIKHPSPPLSTEKEKIIAKINNFKSQITILKLHLYQRLETSTHYHK